MSHADDYFQEVGAIARLIDRAQIERMVDGLAEVRAAQGRLFVLGVGGGAGNAGHAVNDFRKLCGIEAYALGPPPAKWSIPIVRKGRIKDGEQTSKTGGNCNQATAG
jgi:hypothetical protein